MGRPFSGIIGFAHSFTVGNAAVKYELTFDTQRDGKDVYKLTYATSKDGNSQTKTIEVTYEGKRTVLIDDEYGTLVLQMLSER